MRAIGATEFNIQRGIYTYIELTEPNGRRVSLQQVITSPKMDGYLALGTSGIFYLRNNASKHLRGFKSDSEEVYYVGRNFRFRVEIHLVWTGLLLSLFLIVPIVVFGLCQRVASLVEMNCRHKVFYRTDHEERNRLQDREAVRI